MDKKALPPVSGQVSESRYCYVADSIKPAQELSVACAGRELCDPEFRVSRSDFPCFGLEFVSSGAGQLILAGQVYPLHAGILFCYGPGISHQIMNRAAHPMTKYFVDFWGEEAIALLRKSKCRPGHATQIVEVEILRGLFDQMIAEGSRKAGASAKLCAAYLRIILLKATEGMKPTVPGEFSLLARFRRWRDFIENNHHRLHDLNEIAGELAVRPAYLCRVFKQFGQPSPFRYLTQLKMNRAADLLAGAGFSVKAAALEVGYSDPYHFSRLFKKHFGHAPVRFLERHWRVRSSSDSAEGAVQPA